MPETMVQGRILRAVSIGGMERRRNSDSEPEN